MSKIKLKMRIGVKRILSVFLTLMLVQAGVPFMRFTASAVLELKGETSEELQSKIDEAQDGDTIKISGNFNIKKTITIDKDITLSGGRLVRKNIKGAIISVVKGKVTIENITIDGKGFESNENTAVEVGKGCELTMKSGEIINNYAGDYGGGIYNKGTLTIKEGTIIGNTATRGGGIYNKEGTVKISGGTISGNNADYGSGIYNNNGTVIISKGTISGNKAKQNGGGICNKVGTLKIGGGTISGNNANNGSGVYSTGTVEISGGVINGNAAINYGGGVYNSSGNVTISEGTVSENAAKSGGGIYNKGGILAMSGGTMSGNSRDGVYVRDNGKFSVKGSPKIIDNDKSNVRLASEDDYITIEGAVTGLIGVDPINYNIVAVKPIEGYNITQDDFNCFKADGDFCYLRLVNNKIILMENIMEWGQLVQKNGVAYYVNENGVASAEIVGNTKTWLNTKIDGSGSWCSIDNSDGLFKTGSRFYFQLIDGSNINKYYGKIGKKYIEKIEDKKFSIFLIGVIDPDGTPYKKLPSDLTCYVKINPNWDKDRLRAIFINGEKTEDIDVSYVETIESPSNEDKFAKLVIKHFSPYAIYQEKSQEAEIVQESSNDISVADNFATGDSIEYVYILGLWAASVIALAGIVVAKRKFNK